MYQFTRDCLTGIDEIDIEHQQLFENINAAFARCESGTPSVEDARLLIETMKQYAANHLAHEEAYMERTNDPELPRQKREHAQFMKAVEEYAAAPLDENTAPQVLRDMLLYLSKWLYSHILGSDIMIGKGLPQNKEDMFAFTDQYRTGIGFVDEEHEQLFDIIREAYELLHAELLHDKYDGIMDVLGRLKDYTVRHFRDEEEYMARVHYSGLEAQRYAHMLFVERLSEIDLENVDDNQQEYLLELIDYLLGWLTNHILKMDKRIPRE